MFNHNRIFEYKFICNDMRPLISNKKETHTCEFWLNLCDLHRGTYKHMKPKKDSNMKCPGKT